MRPGTVGIETLLACWFRYIMALNVFGPAESSSLAGQCHNMSCAAVSILFCSVCRNEMPSVYNATAKTPFEILHMIQIAHSDGVKLGNLTPKLS
jgi:hypothetical protein